MDACARCGAANAPHVVRIRTTEYLETTLLTGRERYRVRTLDLPALCGPCASGLDRARILADLLCLVPLVALFLAVVFQDSKPVFAAVLVYLIYLARNLDYNWADRLLYGHALERQLAPHTPPGDAGATALPASLLHVAIRVLVIPAGLMAITFLGLRWKAHAPPPPAKLVYPAERLAAARLFFARGEQAAMPVHVGTSRPALASFPMGGKPFMRLSVYAIRKSAPLGGTYAILTGRQVAEAFLADPKATLMVIEGLGEHPVALYRKEVQDLAR